MESNQLPILSGNTRTGMEGQPPVKRVAEVIREARLDRDIVDKTVQDNARIRRNRDQEKLRAKEIRAFVPRVLALKDQDFSGLTDAAISQVLSPDIADSLPEAALRRKPVTPLRLIEMILAKTGPARVDFETRVLPHVLKLAQSGDAEHILKKLPQFDSQAMFVDVDDILKEFPEVQKAEVRACWKSLVDAGVLLASYDSGCLHRGDYILSDVAWRVHRNFPLETLLIDPDAPYHLEGQLDQWDLLYSTAPVKTINNYQELVTLKQQCEKNTHKLLKEHAKKYAALVPAVLGSWMVVPVLMWRDSYVKKSYSSDGGRKIDEAIFSRERTFEKALESTQAIKDSL